MSLFSLLKLNNELSKVPYYSRERILHIQQERLRNLMDYVLAHSSFYKKHYRGVDLSDFDIRSLRPINKSILMKYFDEIVTDKRLKLEEIKAFLADSKQSYGKFYKGLFHLILTSGTSGEEGVIIYDKNVLQYSQALGLSRFVPNPTSNFKRLLRLLLSGERYRMAFFAWLGGHYGSEVIYSQKPKLASLIVDHRVFSLKESPKTIAKELNRFKPHLVWVYPTVKSFLQFFTRYNLFMIS